MHGLLGLVVLVVLGCYLGVLGCSCFQAQPILKRKIPFNNKLFRILARPKINSLKAFAGEQIYAQGLLSEFYCIK